MALFLQKYWKDREKIKDQGWTKQKLWQLPFFKSVPGHLWDPNSLSHEKHPYPIQWIPSNLKHHDPWFSRGSIHIWDSVRVFFFGGWDSVGSQSQDFFPSGRTNFHQPPFIHDILICNGNIWQQRDSLAIFLVLWLLWCLTFFRFTSTNRWVTALVTAPIYIYYICIYGSRKETASGSMFAGARHSQAEASVDVHDVWTSNFQVCFMLNISNPWGSPKPPGPHLVDLLDWTLLDLNVF